MSVAGSISEWLRDRTAYPDAFDRSVVVHETHISWVFLAGDYAYKVKKPVRNDFLDYTTMEQRKRYCDEELRLNRRFAAELYIDVVPILRRGDQITVAAKHELKPHDQVIDYAVKMHRFPENALLSRQLAADQVSREDACKLGARVAQFHESADRSDPASSWGSPSAVLEDAADNLQALRSAASSDGQPLSSKLDVISRWTLAFANRHEGDFAARVTDGFVRECHGDLHLENVIRWRDAIRPFDGIEFSDRFRWIDVLSDLAFLLMDFAARDHLGLGRLLLNQYLEQTGDYQSLALLRWYLVYRAMVRAKVASIRGQQSGLSSAERREVARDVWQHVELAETFCRPSQPRLWITHGLSGSGKTFGTASLVEQQGAVRVRSDIERKRLQLPGTIARDDREQPTGLYSEEANQATYDRLATLTAKLMEDGYSVVVDATFLRREERQRFRQLSESLEVPFRILDFKAPQAVLRSRIEKRLRDGQDASDADLSVLQQQLKSQEPLTDDEQRHTERVGGVNSDGPD